MMIKQECKAAILVRQRLIAYDFVVIKWRR